MTFVEKSIKPMEGIPISFEFQRFCIICSKYSYDCLKAMVMAQNLETFEMAALSIVNWLMDLFSLYVLFSHFRSRDVPKGIFFLFLHKLCIHMHVQKAKFERNFSLE